MTLCWERTGRRTCSWKRPWTGLCQRLYILRQYKRNGLGTRFMNTAFDMARVQGKSVIWLGVWEHNDAAIAFYKRMGFVHFGSHDFVLGEDRQTDLLMEAAVDRLV